MCLGFTLHRTIHIFCGDKGVVHSKIDRHGYKSYYSEFAGWHSRHKVEFQEPMVPVANKLYYLDENREWKSR